jgi:hypothetical protein
MGNRLELDAEANFVFVRGAERADIVRAAVKPLRSA